MNRHCASTARQNGFGLVELMVGVTIGLFLVGGAIALLMSSKQTYTAQDQNARLQEEARMAMRWLAQDLRMARHLGCRNENGNPPIHNLTNNQALTNRPLIETYDGSLTARRWLPMNDLAAPGDATTGSDGIAVRYLSGWRLPLTVDMTATTSHIPVAAGTPASSGDLFALSNCRSTDIFVASTQSSPQQAAGLIPHEVEAVTGPHPTVNSKNDLSGDTYKAKNPVATDPDEQAYLHRFQVIKYHIASVTDESTGALETYLCRGRFDTLLREISSCFSTGLSQDDRLVSGVEDLQITYGIGSANDQGPSQYVTANNVPAGSGAWDESIVSVRIGLLIHGSERSLQQDDTKQYQVNDVLWCAAANATSSCNKTYPNDRRPRQAFVTTIALRNRPN